MLKSYDFTFSHKIVRMISYILYFSATIVFCTCMKAKDYWFLKLLILIQKTIESKGVARLYQYISRTPQSTDYVSNNRYDGISVSLSVNPKKKKTLISNKLTK